MTTSASNLDPSQDRWASPRDGTRTPQPVSGATKDRLPLRRSPLRLSRPLGRRGPSGPFPLTISTKFVGMTQPLPFVTARFGQSQTAMLSILSRSRACADATAGSKASHAIPEGPAPIGARISSRDLSAPRGVEDRSFGRLQSGTLVYSRLATPRVSSPIFPYREFSAVSRSTA